MHVQRLIRWNRPGCRRPDDRMDRPFGRRGETERLRKPLALARDGERKTDVDRDIDAILVFDFRFGERAVAIEAPVDRLEAPVEVAFLEQLPERADLVGLVAVAHRRVRMVPVAEHAETLEIL